MLDHLLTEQRNPASAAIDTAGTEAALRIINREDAKVAEAVEREIPAIARAVDAITGAIERGGRLFYLGAGTSGRLGVLDAAEIPPTFGAPPELVTGIIAGGEAAVSRATEASEDDPATGARDLTNSGFTARDILVGLAASGQTPYVLGAIAEARRLGALTVGVSCTSDSELARGRYRHHAAGGAGGDCRLDAPEGGNGAEVGPQHALHGGVYPVGLRLREPDGECAAEEQQARPSGAADYRRGCASEPGARRRASGGERRPGCGGHRDEPERLRAYRGRTATGRGRRPRVTGAGWLKLKEIAWINS